MSLELINTSVPQGLRPGTSGFCTVAQTPGIPKVLEEQLSLLSGYRWVFQAGHPEANKNPVSWAHWRLSVAGRQVSVLSRVSDAGVDYSQRSNRLAQHLVLEPNELPAAGPAWLMRQPQTFQSAWSGAPRLLTPRRSLPDGENPPRVCAAWQRLTGDAGWAGALVEAFLVDASRPAYILYEPGTDLPPLIDEAIALLPAGARWRVTFNTYFTELPAGLACTWRCCAVGSPAAREAQRLATSALILDLSRPLPAPPEGPQVLAARHGRECAVGVSVSSENVGLTRRRAAVADPTTDEAVAAVPAPTPAVAQQMKFVGAGADTAWMPPASATMVLTGHDGQPPPRSVSERPRAKSNRALSVVFILWPILLVAAIVAWHFSAESEEKRNLTRLNTEARDELAKLRQAHSATTQTSEELRQTAEQLRRSQEELKKTLAASETKRKASDELLQKKSSEVKQLSEQLAHVARDRVQDRASKPPIPASPRPVQEAPIAAPPTPSRTDLVAAGEEESELADADIADGEVLLLDPQWVRAAPRKIEFKHPAPPSSRVVITPDSSGREIQIKLDPQPDAGGATSKIPARTLLRFKIRQDRARKLLTAVMDNTDLDADLKSWLNMSFLEVTLEDGRTINRRLRHAEPSVKWPLQDATVNSSVGFVTKRQIEQLAARVQSSSIGAGWEVSQSGPSLVFKHSSAATFTIGVGVTKGGAPCLTSDFSTAQSNAQEEKRRADNKAVEATDRVNKLRRQSEDSGSDTGKKDEKDKPKAATSEKETAAADAEAATEFAERCKAKVEAFSAVPDFSVALVNAQSQLVLQRFDVTPVVKGKGK